MNEQEILQLTRELMELLQVELEHIDQCIADLDTLRALLIKHNLEGLNDMLQKIRARADRHSIIELNRERITTRLADLVGCDKNKLTIRHLAGLLPPVIGKDLLALRSRLKLSAEKLSREYRATTVLLSDCQRFNQALLSRIFDNQVDLTTNYPFSRTAACQGHLINVKY